MTQTNRERRQFNRIFFSVQDRVSAEFQPPPPQVEPLTGGIMDFSPEGMGVTFEKAVIAKLNQGDRILLKSVRDTPSLSFLKDIEMEIRWVLDHRALAHIGFGCQFIDIPEETRTRIERFMKTYSDTF